MRENASAGEKRVKGYIIVHRFHLSIAFRYLHSLSPGFCQDGSVNKVLFSIVSFDNIMAESLKLLMMSNFSFCYNIFNSIQPINF